MTAGLFFGAAGTVGVGAAALGAGSGVAAFGAGSVDEPAAAPSAAA